MSRAETPGERPSFTHVYQRPSGPILRTVSVVGDRVMVEFDGEQAYIRNICWTHADAVDRLEEHRRHTVESDHAWALDIAARMRRAAKR